MKKNQEQTTEDLNKSIDVLIEDLFSDPVKKGENFEVANASKTTADAAISAAPAMQDDASRGAGRPKEISSVPKVDEDGKRDGQYDASIASSQSETENEEAKKQSKSIDQNSSTGRLTQVAPMKDPRLSKSISEAEYAEYEALKKAKSEADAKLIQEELKKSEDLKKVELENIVKSQIDKAIQPVKKENDDLRKSLQESQALIKAMASLPQRAKSVTGIEALEKSLPENSGPQEFTKTEKLDAAERLVIKKSLPIEAVVELENTGTVYNKQWQAAIEAELQKQN